MLHTLKHLLLTIGLIGAGLGAGFGLTEIAALPKGVRAVCAIVRKGVRTI